MGRVGRRPVELYVRKSLPDTVLADVLPEEVNLLVGPDEVRAVVADGALSQHGMHTGI